MEAASLAEVPWPEAEGDKAHQAFKTTLYQLRKLLGQDDLIPSPGRTGDTGCPLLLGGCVGVCAPFGKRQIRRSPLSRILPLPDLTPLLLKKLLHFTRAIS